MRVHRSDRESSADGQPAGHAGRESESEGAVATRSTVTSVSMRSLKTSGEVSAGMAVYLAKPSRGLGICQGGGLDSSELRRAPGDPRMRCLLAGVCNGLARFADFATSPKRFRASNQSVRKSLGFVHPQKAYCSPWVIKCELPDPTGQFPYAGRWLAGACKVRRLKAAPSTRWFAT